MIAILILFSGCVEDNRMIGSWVQDANVTEAEDIIMDMTYENIDYINSTGSKYLIGPSKSGDTDKVGIYFVDPTKTKTKAAKVDTDIIDDRKIIAGAINNEQYNS